MRRTERERLYLEAKTGQWFVQHESTMDSKPIIVTLYWSVGQRSLRAELAGVVVQYQRDGRYLVPGLGGDCVRLVNGGRTTATVKTEAPLERPKSRCELKYERGRWWKISKRGGSTPLPLPWEV